MNAAHSFSMLLPVLGSVAVLGLVGLWLLVRLSRGHGLWRLVGLVVFGLIAMGVGAAAVLENVPTENTAFLRLTVLDPDLQLLVDGEPSRLDARGRLLLEDVLRLPGKTSGPLGERKQMRRMTLEDRRWRLQVESASLADEGEGWVLGLDLKDGGRRETRELQLQLADGEERVPCRVYVHHDERRFLNRVRHELQVVLDAPGRPRPPLSES